MIKEEIRQKLFSMRDEKYKAFQKSLLPSVEAEKIIGVRTPALRSLAKEIFCRPDRDDFLQSLPHDFFDENQLHAFIISQTKDFDECINQVERFLPYINNWASCDQLLPKAFKNHPEQLLPRIKTWLKSRHTYTVRFAVGMLMQHFLDENFSLEFPKLVSGIESEDYYVNMMLAWYFATALAKQYQEILPFITQNRLPTWVHNKTIQKATESRRISREQKDFLRSLRRR